MRIVLEIAAASRLTKLKIQAKFSIKPERDAYRIAPGSFLSLYVLDLFDKAAVAKKSCDIFAAVFAE
jgi:hypothetical protein